MQTVRVDQLANALAQCVRDGVKLENQRLIKLINDFMCHDFDTVGVCEHIACHTLNEVRLAAAK